MHAGSGLSAKRWQRWFAATRIRELVCFGLGTFLGLMTVTMWQQWSLTFGQDPLTLLAVALTIASGCGLERWWNRARDDRSPRATLVAVAAYLAAWSILHPFWTDSLTVVVGLFPLPALEQSWLRFSVACGLAALGWLIPTTLCAAAFRQIERLTRDPATAQGAVMATLCGAAMGLLVNSLILSPLWGVYMPTVVAAGFVLFAAWRIHRADARSKQPAAVEFPASHPVSSLAASPEPSHAWLQAALAAAVGVALACNLRLSNQLMPHAAFVLFIQLAGVLLGLALGLKVSVWFTRSRHLATWGALTAAGAASLLTYGQPWLVNLSLWMNASFTLVSTLVAARATLLIAIALPFGCGLSWIVSEPRTREGLAGRVAPFAAGLGLATFLLSGLIGLTTLATIAVSLLVAGGVTQRLRDSASRPSTLSGLALAGLSLAALSLPLWSRHDDPSRTAKLLFSTPAFIAYRTGWDLEHLPYLDDMRMIDRREGRTGPITLWRGRVAELYMREAGLPRGVITRTADAVPQFAPEALQAVYSLVMADHPSRVLFLGLSTGVPLATSLNFPIQSAVCVEGDANLIDMIRGPVARETGFDPLSDDRVTLRRISPEWALMSADAEPFDVILSNPLTSSTIDGGAAVTLDYYQRAARWLAPRGIFCQRFECVDYGREPLQIVLKAMQTAFRKVIAVETTAGDLLLFAANSSDALIPADLAARLETSHVSQVLARSGLDWCVLLNQPSYDDAALREISDESARAANSCLHGQLSALAPLEVMRWANKQQELQSTLTAIRQSPVPFPTDDDDDEVRSKPSRRSRLIEWLVEARTAQLLLRRIGEVASQQKLVRENPDAHWWSYRKTLRSQLKDHPRSDVQQVKAVNGKQTPHPEDARRLDYFEALDKAARAPQPTREQIAAVENFLAPYDPLVSYFARQEVADLLDRSNLDPAQELAYRIHVIFFAPAIDASVRNVATAMETLVEHPEVIPDPATRFDALNGLIQTLRIRWEIRQSLAETSVNKILADIDKSLIAAEKSVAMLDELAKPAGIPAQDWELRKQVLERLTLRPLRSYRGVMKARQTRGEAQARALIDEAVRLEKEDTAQP